MIKLTRHFLRNFFGGGREMKTVAGVFALSQLGQAQWGGRDPASLIRDGFAGNPVAHRAVRLVAEAAASIPLIIPHEGGAALMKRPNPDHCKARFFERIYLHLLLSGNAYIEAIRFSEEKAPRALYALRPDLMRVVSDGRGWTEGWIYRAGGSERRILRAADLPSPILQLTLPHPGDDVYGLSPLAAARKALDLSNKSADWAKALLDNAARPSGALVYGRETGEWMTPEQHDQLKTELEAAYSGARNAGRPLVLEGGLDWKPMSLSPADMDFLDARHAAAREIALAVGVPPMLLGIPGDNTYSNYKEANKSLWRETVLPLVSRVASALSLWLSDHFDEDVRIALSLDALPALADERDALWARIGGADFLTVQEKRAALGLDAKEGAR